MSDTARAAVGVRTNRTVFDDPVAGNGIWGALATYFDVVLVRDGTDGRVE